MDFIKATIVGVNFQDLQNAPSSQHIFAEVILIDRTHQGEDPLLYQLSDDTLPNEEELANIHTNGFIPINNHAFSIIGTVDSIDKEKKQIRFKNEIVRQKNTVIMHTVSYNHLIVAAGSEQDEKEFSNALQALMEALKLRKHVPKAQELYDSPYTPQKDSKHSWSQADPDNIDKIVKDTMPKSDAAQRLIDLASLYKRLYEVRIGS